MDQSMSEVGTPPPHDLYKPFGMKAGLTHTKNAYKIAHKYCDNIYVGP